MTNLITKVVNMFDATAQEYVAASIITGFAAMVLGSVALITGGLTSGVLSCVMALCMIYNIIGLWIKRDELA